MEIIQFETRLLFHLANSKVEFYITRLYLSLNNQILFHYNKSVS